jgi:hypothetical protein
VIDEQLAFDIEGMIHEAAIKASPDWAGAPLQFTTAYFSPEDLDAASAHWHFLHRLDDPRAPRRMWRRSITIPVGVDSGNQAFDFFTADLRCEPWKHDEPHGMCACVGDLMYLAICEPHTWHLIASDENTAAEGWHDHAFPGWRDLPIVPARLRSVGKPGLSKAATRWIEEHYPKAMQVDGAPVITERSGLGTRHVAGRSPWGGYDISHTAVDPTREIRSSKPRGARQSRPVFARAAEAPAISLGD